MDPIMAIARKHGIKVIEDVSHAQGGLYKGRKLGTIGDCGAMSLMTGKSFAIGEGGMFVTNDKELYRRVVRWGQYERIKRNFSAQEIVRTNNLPFGGVKNRINQCSAAIGIEQLKKYDAECAVIEKAMRYYHDGIKDVKGIRMIYPEWENSNKAGWYYSRANYMPEAFGGVNVKTFCKALNAELSLSRYDGGCNFPLHTSSIFDDEDIFGNGNPTAKRYLPAGVTPKSLTGRLPVAESILPRVIGDPSFKLFQKEKIDRYIEAVHKVAANIDALRDWEKKNVKKA
jgi:dTDP-4-amino-4,6-dideoxygalactose transaminase